MVLCNLPISWYFGNIISKLQSVRGTVYVAVGTLRDDKEILQECIRNTQICVFSAENEAIFEIHRLRRFWASSWWGWNRNVSSLLTRRSRGPASVSRPNFNGLGLGLACPCLGLGLGGPAVVYRVSRNGSVFISVSVNFPTRQLLQTQLRPLICFRIKKQQKRLNEELQKT